MFPPTHFLVSLHPLSGYRSGVDVSSLARNVKVIAEGVARYIYGLSEVVSVIIMDMFVMTFTKLTGFG